MKRVFAILMLCGLLFACQEEELIIEEPEVMSEFDRELCMQLHEDDRSNWCPSE